MVNRHYRLKFRRLWEYTFCKLAFSLGAMLLLAGCDSFPWLEYRVKLRDTDVVVRLMIRSGGEYRTVIENSYGSVSVSQLPIASAHRRTNLYLTPNQQLVTIDSGGISSRFDIASGQKPKVAANPYFTLPLRPSHEVEANAASASDESDQWKYLGTVYRRFDKFEYFGPSEFPECISLLGAGSTIYRRRYQNEHFCPN